MRHGKAKLGGSPLLLQNPSWSMDAVTSPIQERVNVDERNLHGFPSSSPGLSRSSLTISEFRNSCHLVEGSFLNLVDIANGDHALLFELRQLLDRLEKSLEAVRGTLSFVEAHGYNSPFHPNSLFGEYPSSGSTVWPPINPLPPDTYSNVAIPIDIPNDFPSNVADSLLTDVDQMEDEKRIQLMLKQEKATVRRSALLEHKTGKLKTKFHKIEAIKERKNEEHSQQAAALAQTIITKHAQANQRRESHIEKKKQKAADEGAKLWENAFITALQVENKRREVAQRHQESEFRLQGISGERLKRRSEVAAMQEAALERRRRYEEERMENIRGDWERKKAVEQKREEERLEKEAQRKASKEEKERRLKDFHSTKQAEEAELRRGLEEKLLLGTIRSAQHIEQRKEKAAAANSHSKAVTIRVTASRTEKSYPGHPEDLNDADMLQSHSYDSEHNLLEQFLLVSPIANGQSPSKTTKRKIKRVRQRAQQCLSDYEFIHPSIIKKIGSKRKPILSAHMTEKLVLLGSSNSSRESHISEELLDNILTEIGNEINWLIEKVSEKAEDPTIESSDDRLVEFLQDIDTLVWFICLSQNASAILGVSEVNHALKVLSRWASKRTHNADYLFLSAISDPLGFQSKSPWPVSGNSLESPQHSVVLSLVDLLLSLLSGPSCLAKENRLQRATSLFYLLSTMILSPEGGNAKDEVINYMVSAGVLEIVKEILLIVHGPLLDDGASQFLYEATRFVEAVTALDHTSIACIPVYAQAKQPHFLSSFIKETELVGLVTMLDALLLYKGGSSREAASSELLPTTMIEIALNGIRSLNNMARIDLVAFQEVLHSPAMQLQFFHLVAFWLTHWFTFGAWDRCILDTSIPAAHGDDTAAHGDDTDGGRGMMNSAILNTLLHEILVLVGYAVLGDESNAAILRFGQLPVILQMLSRLPLRYFVEPSFVQYLLPTLIISAQTTDNRHIIEDEFDLRLLSRQLTNIKCVNLPSNSTIRPRDHAKALDLRAPPPLAEEFLGWTAED
ncbi:hypothetical protein BJ742DRAFT_792752 [Cladochytrium replicatum]|nr:hypothetical protein BJ742DRAFT_792752 [Cladochytrium replicatum]